MYKISEQLSFVEIVEKDPIIYENYFHIFRKSERERDGFDIVIAADQEPIKWAELDSDTSFQNVLQIKRLLDQGSCFKFDYTPELDDELMIELRSVIEIDDTLMFTFQFRVDGWVLIDNEIGNIFDGMSDVLDLTIHGEEKKYLFTEGRVLGAFAPEETYFWNEDEGYDPSEEEESEEERRKNWPKIPG